MVIPDKSIMRKIRFLVRKAWCSWLRTGAQTVTSYKYAIGCHHGHMIAHACQWKWGATLEGALRRRVHIHLSVVIIFRLDFASRFRILHIYQVVLTKSAFYTKERRLENFLRIYSSKRDAGFADKPQYTPLEM